MTPSSAAVSTRFATRSITAGASSWWPRRAARAYRPEGGAHQSILTPAVALEMPGLEAYEPTFAVEVEWLLLSAIGRVLGEGDCPAFYLRLSTKPVDQNLLPADWLSDPLKREVLRGNVLGGGYLLHSAKERARLPSGRERGEPVRERGDDARSPRRRPIACG